MNPAGRACTYAIGAPAARFLYIPLRELWEMPILHSLPRQAWEWRCRGARKLGLRQSTNFRNLRGPLAI